MTSVLDFQNKKINSEEIKKRADELRDEVVKVRRWLHQHAEVSWKEYESTEYITAYLENLGLEVHHYPDHTGCWTMIEGGQCSPESKTILLRADFDALPIQEETGESFASIHPGVFHGCGHEMHG